MSDTFRQSVLNRLPAMPPTRAPWADPLEGDEVEEVEEADGMGDLDASLPGPSRRFKEDLSPISASSYFAQALEIQPDGSDTTFRAYYTPPSASSPSSAAASGQRATDNGKGTVLVCHHGAGASGLSFAALAKEVHARDAELGVLAYDARGHGKSRTSPLQEEHNLRLENLSNDLKGIIQHMYPDPTSAPALLLLGHSMGAAPILSAAPLLQAKGYNVPGVIVLDVVEGTAIESLPLMPSILAKRPRSFRSVEHAISWHLSSHSIRNTTSARVSVPSYVKPATPDGGPDGEQIWRADLLVTEPYWMEWWQGLSNRFLDAKCARMLVLAGKERLDKDLMVGQMQGKFQLEVMQDVGHYLHEASPLAHSYAKASIANAQDDPRCLAQTIITFWRRNTRVLVLPPKIGQGWSGQMKKPEVAPAGEQ